jgi:hypothetical protein
VEDGCEHIKHQFCKTYLVGSATLLYGEMHKFFVIRSGAAWTAGGIGRKVIEKNNIFEFGRNFGCEQIEQWESCTDFISLSAYLL